MHIYVPSGKMIKKYFRILLQLRIRLNAPWFSFPIFIWHISRKKMKENGRKENRNMYLPVGIQGCFHELILMGFQCSIWYKSFLTKLAFERLILFMNWFNGGFQYSFFWKYSLKKLAFEWVILFMNWFNMGFQCSICEKYVYKKLAFERHIFFMNWFNTGF